MSALLWRRDDQAIRLPSGLQLAYRSGNASNVSCFLPEPSAFITHSSPARPWPPFVHTIRLPSGENSGKSSSTLSFVRFTGFEPSAYITQMSHCPPRLLANAIKPSGLAAGAGSAEQANSRVAIAV